MIEEERIPVEGGDPTWMGHKVAFLFISDLVWASFIFSMVSKSLKAVCHAFDWVIWTIQRIVNFNGC